MNLFDWVAVLLVGVVTFWIWRKPVILVLESLVALIVGVLLSSVFLSPVLILLEKWGWRENLYTPAFIFLFLLILIWGIFFVLFSSLFSHYEGKAGILSKPSHPYSRGFLQRCGGKVLALPLALVFVAGFAGLGCLVLPPFISSQRINSSLSDSHCCSYVKKSKLASVSGLKALQGRISEVYTPPSENEALILPDNLKIGAYNPDLAPELLQLINGERVKAGLGTLEYSEDLSRLAKSYGSEIATTRFLSHLNQEGKTPADRANEQKIKFNYLGENLAIAGTLNAAHQALMDSPNHRDNILSPVFRRVGIATFQVSPNGVLVIKEYTN